MDQTLIALRKANSIEVISNVGELSQTIEGYVKAVKSYTVLKEWSSQAPVQIQVPALHGIQTQQTQMVIMFSYVLIVKRESE